MTLARAHAEAAQTFVFLAREAEPAKRGHLIDLAETEIDKMIAAMPQGELRTDSRPARSAKAQARVNLAQARKTRNGFTQAASR